MKRTFYLIIYAVMVTLLISCKLSTEQLSNEIKKEMIRNFDAKDLDIKILSLTLVHESGNNYSGILETKEPNGEFKYTVDVVYDGDCFKYEINGSN